MIEKIPDLPHNVLGFSAKGTVNANDYDSVIIPAVEAMFARNARFGFSIILAKTSQELKRPRCGMTPNWA